MSNVRQEWIERVQQYLNFQAKRWPLPVNYVIGGDLAEPLFRERVPGMVFSVYHLDEADTVPSGEATEMFVPFPAHFTVTDVEELCEMTIAEHILFGMVGKPQ